MENVNVEFGEKDHLQMQYKNVYNAAFIECTEPEHEWFVHLSLNDTLNYMQPCLIC